MTDLGNIFETYLKYGWTLRRLVYSQDSPRPDVDGDVILTEGPVNAAWFSRPPTDGPVAWEIRFLGEPPFALLENLDEGDPEFESQLKVVEERLAAAVLSKLDKRTSCLQT